MFDSSNSNSDQICRICLTPASDLTLIFEGNDSNISNILMSLAMISVQFTNYICSYYLLKKLYE